jgi:hypothetical protein
MDGCIAVVSRALYHETDELYRQHGARPGGIMMQWLLLGR